MVCLSYCVVVFVDFVLRKCFVGFICFVYLLAYVNLCISNVLNVCLFRSVPGVGVFFGFIRFLSCLLLHQLVLSNCVVISPHIFRFRVFNGFV